MTTQEDCIKPSILEDIYDYSVCWQMSPHERASILHLISLLPSHKLAVEIGCYTGGFLRQLSKRFDQVISFDIDHKHLDKSAFSNVHYIEGDSRITVPQHIDSIKDCSLFLVDGDHSYECVLADVDNLLNYIPTSETVILVHDSWYLLSRKALLDVNFHSNPYIDLVDLDFCSGSYAHDKWVGGVCLIHMMPDPRKDDNILKQSEVLGWRRAHALR